MDDIIEIDLKPTNMDTRAICSNCAHYSTAKAPHYPPEGQPICKRYPPTIHPIVVGEKVQLAPLWPHVTPEEQCGEFEKATN